MTDLTMTCDRLVDALDDVLDGQAGAPLRAAVDAHLESCAACRALAHDVRAIRAAARTLEPIEPPPAVWARVEARVGAHTAPSTWLDRLAAWSSEWLGVLQPVAAAAVLVLLVSALVWVAARLGEPQPELIAGIAGNGVSEFALAEAEYAEAIARLEDATAGPQALDEVTSATLQSTIADIDSAIGDARDALAREPGDELSQESLLDALGSKVALLQDTVALLGEADGRAEARNP